MSVVNDQPLISTSLQHCVGEEGGVIRFEQHSIIVPPLMAKIVASSLLAYSELGLGKATEGSHFSYSSAAVYEEGGEVWLERLNIS